VPQFATPIVEARFRPCLVISPLKVLPLGSELIIADALHPVRQFATPIVKAKKKTGKQEMPFFTLQEYSEWRETVHAPPPL
jgi:hypothetical protein